MTHADRVKSHLTMANRKYKNPPIEEALCEVRFSGGPEWDLSTAGKLQTALRGTYPGTPRNQAILEASFRLPSIQPGALVELKPAAQRLQFPDSDEHRMADVAPGLLSVHLRRPYGGWEEEFRPLIDEALAAFEQTTSPTGVTRIGLRYINRIAIAQEAIQLEDYFLGVPRYPAQLPGQFGAIMTRVESLYEDRPVKLVVTFASLRAAAGQVAFLLDLDLMIEWTEQPLPLEQAMAQIEDLRNRERAAFEALITDSTREVFDAPVSGVS